MPVRRASTLVCIECVGLAALAFTASGCGDETHASPPVRDTCVADVAVDGAFSLDVHREYECTLQTWQRNAESVTVSALLSESGGELRLRIFGLGADALGESFNAAFALFPPDGVAPWSAWDIGWPDIGGCTATILEQRAVEGDLNEATLLDAGATCPEPLLPATSSGGEPPPVGPLEVQRLRVRSFYGAVLE